MGTKIDKVEETMRSMLKEIGAAIMRESSNILQQLQGIVSRVAELETK